MGREARVFLGNLTGNCRERDIEKFFKSYGKLRDIVIKHGYGFVEFDDMRDAEDAVHDLDGKELNGERLRVEMAKSRNGGGERGGDRGRRDGGGDRGGRDRRGGGDRDRDRDRRDGGRDRGSDAGRRGGPPGPKTGYRISVDNISSRTSWQDLKDFFRKFGDITYANAHSPRLGEGVVEFAERRGMEKAIDDNGNLELDGKRLDIIEEDKRAGASDGRRGGRSRSRTRSGGDNRTRSRSPVSGGGRSSRGGDKYSRSRSGTRSDRD